MSDNLRSKMIRLTASMPKGSSERKALLNVLSSAPPSPAEMARRLKAALGGLGFQYLRVHHTPFGVAVEVSRHGTDEDYARAQVTSGWTVGPNVRTVVSISAGTMFGDRWENGPLSVTLQGRKEDQEEVRSVGVTLRRASGLTHEQAFKKVVDFFKKNAAKLQG
jgi:hypothetical protein